MHQISFAPVKQGGFGFKVGRGNVEVYRPRNMAGQKFLRRAHVQNHVLLVVPHAREFLDAQICIGSGGCKCCASSGMTLEFRQDFRRPPPA